MQLEKILRRLLSKVIMFDFFIALFGGIYFLVRCLIDKYHRIEHSRRYSLYEQVRHLISNTEIETKKINEIKHGSIHDRQMFINELHDELKDIFGESFMELYRDCIINWNNSSPFWSDEQPYPQNEFWVPESPYTFAPTGGFGNIWCVAYQIWLSKIGLIPSSVTEYNINHHISGAQYDKRCEYAKKAMSIIEHNIQNAHPELNIKLLRKNSTVSVYEWSHWANIYMK